MEGWDGDADGHPTDLVRRRWRRFGESGAKLVWGGEAVAVTHDGRANPRQLVIDRSTVDELAALRAELVDAHVAAHANDDGLVDRPAAHALRPVVAPDRRGRSRGSPTTIPSSTQRVGADADALLSDDDLDALVATYVDAAALAADAGLRLRRRQALPRLPPPRAARRASTGRARTAGRSSTAPRSCAASSRASAPACPGSASACACRPTTSCRTRPAPTASARPSRDASALARYAFGGDGVRPRRRPHRGAPVPRPVPRARHRAGVHHRRQPVLQPAHPATGVLPAVRRLHAARGPARRRGADDRGHRRADARASRRRGRGLGLLVPPAVAAQRRPARGPHRRRGRRSASAAACSATRTCRPTCSPAGPCRRRCCAARSATAPPRPATGSCPAATRSTTSTRTRPERIELAAIKKATRKRTRR